MAVWAPDRRVTLWLPQCTQLPAEPPAINFCSQNCEQTQCASQCQETGVPPAVNGVDGCQNAACQSSKEVATYALISSSAQCPSCTVSTFAYRNPSLCPQLSGASSSPQANYFVQQAGDASLDVCQLCEYDVEANTALLQSASDLESVDQMMTQQGSWTAPFQPSVLPDSWSEEARYADFNDSMAAFCLASPAPQPSQTPFLGASLGAIPCRKWFGELTQYLQSGGAYNAARGPSEAMEAYCSGLTQADSQPDVCDCVNATVLGIGPNAEGISQIQSTLSNLLNFSDPAFCWYPPCQTALQTAAQWSADPGAGLTYLPAIESMITGNCSKRVPECVEGALLEYDLGTADIHIRQTCTSASSITPPMPSSSSPVIDGGQSSQTVVRDVIQKISQTIGYLGAWWLLIVPGACGLTAWLFLRKRK